MHSWLLKSNVHGVKLFGLGNKLQLWDVKATSKVWKLGEELFPGAGRPAVGIYGVLPLRRKRKDLRECGGRKGPLV